jgi:hypothetical protein
LGTWIRNQLLYPGGLRAECAAVVRAPTFEALRPPPSIDELSELIIRRVWERLRMPS